MFALANLIRYWREIGLGILAVAAILGVLHIRHTYSRVDAQEREIVRLKGEVENAKKAVMLQATVAYEKQKIDQKTYSSVRAILRSPVPRVLVPGGV